MKKLTMKIMKAQSRYTLKRLIGILTDKYRGSAWKTRNKSCIGPLVEALAGTDEFWIIPEQ